MSGTERIVNAKQLSALVRESVNTRDRTASISGTFRERVGEAVENGNLDRKAFNIVSGLAKMKDDVARDRAIRNIPLYIDMLREEGLFPAEHVGDLADMAEQAGGEGGEPDGEDEPGDERNPIAAAAEKAWNDADPANAEPPKPPRKSKVGMGDADGSYKLQ